MCPTPAEPSHPRSTPQQGKCPAPVLRLWICPGGTPRVGAPLSQAGSASSWYLQRNEGLPEGKVQRRKATTVSLACAVEGSEHSALVSRTLPGSPGEHSLGAALGAWSQRPLGSGSGAGRTSVSASQSWKKPGWCGKYASEKSLHNVDLAVGLWERRPKVWGHERERRGRHLFRIDAE